VAREEIANANSEDSGGLGSLLCRLGLGNGSGFGNNYGSRNGLRYDWCRKILCGGSGSFASTAESRHVCVCGI
jgi:hypothetical protein